MQKEQSQPHLSESNPQPKLKKDYIYLGIIAVMTILALTFLTLNFAKDRDDSKNKDSFTSANVWYDVDLPKGWSVNESQAVAQKKDKLSKAQVNTSYRTKDEGCYYSVEVSYRENMKLSNLLEPYSTSANSLANAYENLDKITNVEGSNVELNTTDGKVKAPVVSFNSQYDLNADGKKDTVHESNVLYIATDSVKKEGNPVISINFSCVDKEWSQEKLQKMIDSTTFYTQNEKPKAKDRGEGN